MFLVCVICLYRDEKSKRNLIKKEVDITNSVMFVTRRDMH